MSAFSSIIRYPKGMDYDGKDADEKIVLVIRRSTITNLPWMLTAFIFAFVPFFVTPFLTSIKVEGVNVISLPFMGAITLFWYLFTFGYFFSCFTNWYFNILLISNKKIVDMDFHGITYKNISETMIENIEDVTSNISGPVGTIFNIGHIFIQTAGEKREFEFTDVANPSQIRDIISDLVASTKENQRHANN
jgi:membrane protein YdbS with pleckstrin-like domain